MLRSYLLELHHIKTQNEKWAKDKLAYIPPVSADHFRLPDNGNGIFIFILYVSEYGTGHSRAVLLFCNIPPVSADHFRLPDNGNGFFLKYVSEYGTGHSRAVLLFCKYSWGQL